MGKIIYNVLGRIVSCAFSDSYSHMYQTYECLGTKLVGRDKGIDYAMDYMDMLEEQQHPFVGPVGYARCNPKDKFVEEVGKKIALNKMLCKFTDYRIRFIQYIMEQESTETKRVNEQGYWMLRKLFDLQDNHGIIRNTQEEDPILALL